MSGIDKAKLFEQLSYTPMEHQWLFHRAPQRFRVAVCGRRAGKALPITTPIPTPYGWRRLSEIEVGDLVFGANGKPTMVTGATDVMYGHNCFKIVFDDGTSIIADEEHQWFTYDKPARKALSDPRRHTKPRVRTTLEIANTLLTNTAKPESNHSIPMPAPVEFEPANLPLDPYVLGIWLGDGGSGGKLSTSDQEILDELEIRGFSNRHISEYDYYIYGLHTKLREMGLNNVNSRPRIYKKIVPKEYLTASIDQRLELLQGLMDSDGTVDKRRGQCTFDNGNLNLAKSVLYLCRSLGIKAYFGSRVSKLNGIEHGTSYRVWFSTHLPVFKLKRKLQYSQTAKLVGRARQRFIMAVEPVDSVPVRCIEVASTDSLYLASSSFIVTHNTEMVGNDRIANLLEPKTLGWIVGPTYDLGMKEFRVMWDSLIVNGKLGHDKRIKKNFSVKSGDMHIEMPWGARVEVRSATHPETLVGDGLAWVIMSEAAKQSLETWEKYIRPALADKRGTADFVTTPEGKNWIYDLYKLGRSKPDLYKSFRFPSWVNNVVFPDGENDEEILHLKDALTEEYFLQEIAADFTSLVGRIFNEFDEEVHVLPVAHEFNPQWANYIAFDWGFTAPLAAIEFQVSPRDEIYVWREHYVTNRTLEWHINSLKERHNPEGYHLDGAFGDAADPQAVEYVSQHLVYCQADPDSKMWLPGIRLMNQALKQHEVGKDEYDRPVMRPRYFVDPDCENHISEMINYRARKGISPNEFKGSSVVERNSADHSIDAMRYALMHLWEVGVQHHLDEVYDVVNMGTPRETITISQEDLELVGAGPTSFFNFNLDAGGGRF